MASVNSSAFQRWSDFLDPHEGGVANRPAHEDPGGLTNRGLTIGAFQTWGPSLGYRDTSAAALLRLTKSDVDKFKALYWRASWADRINSDGVAVQVADMYWGSGMDAFWSVQRALNDVNPNRRVTVDGKIGTQTLAAINAAPAGPLIEAIHRRREEFLRSLRNFSSNPGWIRRNNELRDLARELHATQGGNSGIIVAIIALLMIAGGVGLAYYSGQSLPFIR